MGCGVDPHGVWTPNAAGDAHRVLYPPGEYTHVAHGIPVVQIEDVFSDPGFAPGVGAQRQYMTELDRAWRVLFEAVQEWGGGQRTARHIEQTFHKTFLMGPQYPKHNIRVVWEAGDRGTFCVCDAGCRGARWIVAPQFVGAQCNNLGKKTVIILGGRPLLESSGMSGNRTKRACAGVGRARSLLRTPSHQPATMVQHWRLLASVLAHRTADEGATRLSTDANDLLSFANALRWDSWAEAQDVFDDAHMGEIAPMRRHGFTYWADAADVELLHAQQKYHSWLKDRSANPWDPIFYEPLVIGKVVELYDDGAVAIAFGGGRVVLQLA
eukprot:gene19036-33785_t